MADVQPHDALMKVLFGTPERATALLRGALPPDVCAALDWPTLRQLPTDLVDDDLHARVPDFLFAVMPRSDANAAVDSHAIHARAAKSARPEEAYVAVLLEHQSRQAKWMALRLLGGTVRLLERARGKSLPSLPVVLPVVLHHGKRPWTAPQDLEALLAVPPPLAAFVAQSGLRFRYFVLDLATLDDDALAALAPDVFALLALAALRDSRTAPDLTTLLLGLAGFVERYRRDGDLRAALDLVLRYTAHVRRAEAADLRKIIEVSGALPPLMEDDMKTIAQALQEMGEVRGEARGVVLGEARGLSRSLLRVVERRFGAVPEALRARIASADMETLERWIDRAISVQRAEDVLDG